MTQTNAIHVPFLYQRVPTPSQAPGASPREVTNSTHLLLLPHHISSCMPLYAAAVSHPSPAATALAPQGMVAGALMRLLGCNVYISEGRNLQLIRRLEAACSQHPRTVVLAHTFIDEPYNRTGLTLAATSIPELVATVQAVAQHALQHIDLSTHAAQHPRLGVLDHVSLHPLGPQATLSLAAQAATAVGQQLAQSTLQLPVYFYGAAHPQYRRLAEIRRRLGYFKPTTNSGSSSSSDGGGNSEGWCGSVSQLQLSAYPPDAGPAAATPAAGVVTIGAVPWVTNYNVPLHTHDMAAAKAIARAVSSKGGGLPGVEAMALPHGPGVIEIATNLIAYDWRTAASNSTGQQTGSDGSSRQAPGESSSGIVQGDDGSWEVEQLAGAGPAEVAAAVAREAQRLGLPPPGPGYITNKTPPELIAAAAERLQC